MELAKDQIVCERCLIYDGFFIDGGSWIPDRCPNCKGTNCKMYDNLDPISKIRANFLLNKMWKEKYGN